VTAGTSGVPDAKLMAKDMRAVAPRGEAMDGA